MSTDADQSGNAASRAAAFAERKRKIAVALAYRPQTDSDAPRVVATGRGEDAARIVEIAFASGVKVREDSDLAEILAAVDLDSVIPLEAFMAVAEILAYVYRMNNQDPPLPSESPKESP